MSEIANAGSGANLANYTSSLKNRTWSFSDRHDIGQLHDAGQRRGLHGDQHAQGAHPDPDQDSVAGRRYRDVQSHGGDAHQWRRREQRIGVRPGNQRDLDGRERSRERQLHGRNDQLQRGCDHPGELHDARCRCELHRDQHAQGAHPDPDQDSVAGRRYRDVQSHGGDAHQWRRREQWIGVRPGDQRDLDGRQRSRERQLHGRNDRLQRGCDHSGELHDARCRCELHRDQHAQEAHPDPDQDGVAGRASRDVQPHRGDAEQPDRREQPIGVRPGDGRGLDGRERSRERQLHGRNDSKL